MCTNTLAPDSSVPRLQVRVWLPAAPVIVQLPCAGCVSIDQSTPVPDGSGSSTVTSVAAPAPPLLMVTLKPTGSLTSTGLASAVFAMPRLGHCTVVDAGLWNGPPFSLVTDTEAV